MRIAALALLAGLCASCVAGKGGASDRVEISGLQVGEVRLLADGRAGNDQVNDWKCVGPCPIVAVGKNLAGSPTSNDLVGFAYRRPMAMAEQPGWTVNADTVPLKFRREIRVPITIWILVKPFGFQRMRALIAAVRTMAIWRKERMGVVFSEVKIVDASMHPKAAQFRSFTCGMADDLQAAIGRDQGRVNVYYVDKVEGDTHAGDSCGYGTEFIALGQHASPDLLAHELGHTFYLFHIDADENFDARNVMHSNPPVARKHLTEGQIFQAHLVGESALNDTYQARPGEPVWEWIAYTGLNPARRLAIHKRLWADGVLPEN
jgi:hypothetical protein